VREVEKVIVKHFPKEEVKDRVKQQVAPLSIDKVAVQFTASVEFAEKLKKVQALLSHKNPEGSLAAIFDEALDLLLEKHTPKERTVAEPVKRGRAIDTRNIPRGIRGNVWRRDGAQCTFVSQTGHRCRETRFLQVDHVHPRVLGGSSHEVANLRLLCSTHNRFRAKETFRNAWVRES
jgi:hypothetical protein